MLGFEAIIPLLPPRLQAVTAGNLSFYDGETYRGHVRIDVHGPHYHERNLAPLVIVPALCHASRAGLLGIRLDHIMRPLDWLHTNRSLTVDEGLTGIHGDMPSERDTLWVKYTAEMLHAEALAVEILDRLGDIRAQTYLGRALSRARFLMLAAEHGFAPKLSLSSRSGVWVQTGWHTPGRAVEALAALHDSPAVAPEERPALRQAVFAYGDKLLQLWRVHGPYLRDEERVRCFDSDIAAAEIRGLVLCYRWMQGDNPAEANDYLEAANAFAQWLTDHQATTGAYPVRAFPSAAETTARMYSQQAIEQRHEPGSALDTVGITSPGDTANITLALIRLMEATRDVRWRANILAGLNFCLNTQCLDPASAAYGLPPSWRDIEDVHDWTVSKDGTYSGDQGGHLSNVLLAFRDSWRDFAALYRD